MSVPEKRGALLCFGKGGCVTCHAVAGQSNGPGQNEDFGLEQVTGNPADRYKFRSSPLRNVALQPAFFHNGAFTRLEDAIYHHLHVFESARTCDPVRAGVDPDLRLRLGPIRSWPGSIRCYAT
ncbi:MAG TPA: hypothetical protein VMH81_36500, partial [Bryobacteraceae bacterium]|nr:hypothetical protein [Bryobacteraceae bacterium]